VSEAGERGTPHDLLPWYVAGTLTAAEADAFREHLASCATCHAELGLVGELRERLERHGRDWIAEHPSAEELVATVREPAADDHTARVQRHLALCDECALEASWIRGQTTAWPAPQTESRPARAPRRGAGIGLALLAAAAGLVLGLLLPFGSTEDAPGVVVPAFIPGAMRDDAPVPQVAVASGRQTLLLFFEVDFPPASFPLALDLLDARGERLLRQERIGAASLHGAHLFLEVPVALVPPGRYVARITGASASEPPLLCPFEVVPPAAQP
jgi:hypothetical protein